MKSKSTGAETQRTLRGSHPVVTGPTPEAPSAGGLCSALHPSTPTPEKGQPYAERPEVEVAGQTREEEKMTKITGPDGRYTVIGPRTTDMAGIRIISSSEMQPWV